MSLVDWIVVGVYFIFTIGLGIFVGNKTNNTSDFFSGGKSFKWWAIGLSVMATQISAITFIGAPGWAYEDGLKPLVLNLNIPIVMWYLGGTFIPFFYNLGIVSIYEYIENRFGKTMRVFLVITYILKMLLVIGSIVYIPSLLLSRITGMSITITILLIVVVSIFYTALGGIQTVIWTDVFQMVALWIGIIISIITALKLTPYSFKEILDIARVNDKLISLDFNYSMRVANTFWAGIIGGGILHLAYFGVDQTQVQRVLTAKSIKNAKYSLWFSGVFSVIQMFLFLLIGIILYVFYNGKEFVNLNDVYIKFALENIPKGYLGVIISAIFAATMSSIDSSLNSMTTVFIKDIYNPYLLKKDSKISEMNLTKIITVVFGVLIAYCALNMSNSNSSILETISKYGSYLLGATLGVFVLGMFTVKANEKGVCLGFLLGIIGTSFISSYFQIFWMWNNLVGFLISLVVGYLCSNSTIDERMKNYKNTIKGLKISDNKVESVYNIPGRFEKNSYLLVLYFTLVIVILYFFQ